jgi:ferredoxin-type protein NapH
VSTRPSLVLRPGAEAIAAKGWLAAHKWLILRRTSQIGILLLFLVGPWFGIWIVKGNLAFSYTLNFLPLADPYVILQSLLARQVPERLALIGVVHRLAALPAGRWPHLLLLGLPGQSADRSRLLAARAAGLKGSAHISRPTRYWMLGMTLVAAMVTGSIAWEMVNPVSMMHRGLIFGIGSGLGGAAGGVPVRPVRHAPRLVRPPVPGRRLLQPDRQDFQLARIRLPAREACNDCMDCFAVCPEPQVIRPALKGDRRRAAGHPRSQLHQLRSLHRCLLEGCVRLRHPFQSYRATCRRGRVCDSEITIFESRLGSPS